MLNWHKTCTLKLKNLESTLTYIAKNTSNTYTLKCTHTLLATNDINYVLLTATFTISIISKFRTIQNHSRQLKSYQTPKYKKTNIKKLYH